MCVYLTSFVTFFFPYAFFLIYFLRLTGLLPDLSIPSRIGSFPFQAGGRRRRPNLTVVFVLTLCCNIFCFVYECVFAFVVLDLVLQYLAKRWAGKNVFEMTYFVSGGT